MSLLLLAGTSLSPAYAQDAGPAVPIQAPPPALSPPAAEEPAPAASAAPSDGTEIVVTGQRLRGEVPGNVEPEVRLNEDEIRAYGATSVGELVNALAPQTRSGRGRQDGPPIVLLNGQRIANFGEIRDLPPEAIERVDILPEEVALSYGYRADQRVVNIILKQDFRAVTLSAGFGIPTAGGRSSIDGQGNILRIDRGGRWSVDAQYSRAGALFEDERDLEQSAPSFPFDLTGNVGASPFTPTGEVDPALSVAAGTRVTVAAVPGSAANGAPTLGSFVPGANNPNVTDLGRFRTLLPQTESLQLNGTFNRRFGRLSATVNARIGDTSSESRFGLPSLTLTLPETNPYSPFSGDVTLFRFTDAVGPLVREQNGRTYHGGLTLDSNIGGWRWTFTSNYDRARTVTRTDTNADPAAIQTRLNANDPTLNPFGPLDSLIVLRPEDRAESVVTTADAQVVFNGSPFSLPAGPVISSLTLGGNKFDIESETFRSGVTTNVDLSRERAAALGSLDLPLTSRREGFLSAVGNISLNLNFEVEHFSDFGTLRTLGYGIRWEPVEPLDLSITVTDEDGVPTISQLGEPVIVTPNVRTFDFTRGETVDVTRIDGGNPALIADSRRVFGARATLRLLGGGGGPVPTPNLSLTANYTRTRIDDPISSFPIVTPEIEAAFPERFVRDADGRLIQFDSRPLNYARADREEMRWGINFSRPFPAPAGAQQRPGIPGGGGRGPGAGGGGPRGPGGGGGGGRGPGGGGRGGGMFGGGQGGGMQVSLFHTWRFQDEVLIRPGVPVLDYLDGSAFSGRGGRPRHEVELTAGIFKSGLGGFVQASWQSSTFVQGTPTGQGGTAGDLRFGSFATVNLNLFADLGQQQGLVRRFPWANGLRVFVGIQNVLDGRLRVRDETGATPISYQPDYLDPLGRSVRIGIRKIFF